MSISTTPPIVALFRGYVTDFVNRQDFSATPRYLAESYTLYTSGVEVCGRDGPYREAVARQFAQFPGLVYTLHEIYPTSEAVAVRFTEHGSSNRHAGRCAGWSSIAIYRALNGLLATCTIEQDYFSRRRQLDTGEAIIVDAPAIAPWDAKVAAADADAENAVRGWLAEGVFTECRFINIDDSQTTGYVDPIIHPSIVEVLDIMSSGPHVAFHAVQKGRLTGDFARIFAPLAGSEVYIHLGGLVTVAAGSVIHGNVIRDRFGLYRRLASG
jgi:SnoaL-like domain